MLVRSPHWLTRTAFSRRTPWLTHWTCVATRLCVYTRSFHSAFASMPAFAEHLPFCAVTWIFFCHSPYSPTLFAAVRHRVSPHLALCHRTVLLRGIGGRINYSYPALFSSRTRVSAGLVAVTTATTFPSVRVVRLGRYATCFHHLYAYYARPRGLFNLPPGPGPITGSYRTLNSGIRQRACLQLLDIDVVATRRTRAARSAPRWPACALCYATLLLLYPRMPATTTLRNAGSYLPHCL